MSAIGYNGHDWDDVPAVLTIERDLIRTSSVRVWLPAVLVRKCYLEFTVMGMRSTGFSPPASLHNYDPSAEEPVVGLRVDGQDLWAPHTDHVAELVYKGGSTGRRLLQRTIGCELDTIDHDIAVIVRWDTERRVGAVQLERVALVDAASRARRFNRNA